MEGGLIFLSSRSGVGIFNCFIENENFHPGVAFGYLEEICFHRLLHGF